MTVEAALEKALATNPRLEASRAQLEAARGRVRAWGAQANPLVDVGVSAGGANVGSRDEDLIVTQTLDLSQQRASRRQAAESARDAAEAEFQAAANDLARDVRFAYIDAQVARDQAALAVEAVERLTRLQSAVERRVEQGAAPQTSALRAEVETMRARQAAQMADTQLSVALVQLGALLGTAIAPKCLDRRLPDGRAGAEGEDLLAIAHARRPELRAQRARVVAQEQEVRAVGQGRYPDLVLAGRRARVFAAQADLGVRATLQFPLLDFGTLGGAQAEAEAVLTERRALLVAEERRVTTEVESARARLAGARRTLDAYGAGILSRSLALARKAQTGYDAGVYALFEVLDAQESVRLARAAQLNAAQAVAHAEAELAWATGLSTPVSIPGTPR